MAGGSNGYRVALVRRQLTPGLISSLLGTAGLPAFISFSTNYPKLDFCTGNTEALLGSNPVASEDFCNTKTLFVRPLRQHPSDYSRRMDRQIFYRPRLRSRYPSPYL